MVAVLSTGRDISILYEVKGREGRRGERLWTLPPEEYLLINTLVEAERGIGDTAPVVADFLCNGNIARIELPESNRTFIEEVASELKIKLPDNW